jgi:hypothetical protein
MFVNIPAYLMRWVADDLNIGKDENKLSKILVVFIVNSEELIFVELCLFKMNINSGL